MDDKLTPVETCYAAIRSVIADHNNALDADDADLKVDPTLLNLARQACLPAE